MTRCGRLLQAFLIKVDHPGVDADDCTILSMILASEENKIVSPVQLKDITPDDVEWGGRKSACLKGLLQKARSVWQSRQGAPFPVLWCQAIRMSAVQYASDAESEDESGSEGSESEQLLLYGSVLSCIFWRFRCQVRVRKLAGIARVGPTVAPRSG